MGNVIAADVGPKSRYIKEMLPSLGFFGGTWADCLELHVGRSIAKVRIENRAPGNEFLNIRGVLARYRGRYLEMDESAVQIRQSSVREASNLSPQGVSTLSGIHTLRESNAWWEIEFDRSREVDTLLVFNRADGLGTRGRRLCVSVEDAEGATTVLYDPTGIHFVRKTMMVLERFAGNRISSRPIGSRADAAKWRTDVVRNVALSLRQGNLGVSSSEWRCLAALIPTVRGGQAGQDLNGDDWFLLAYGVCAQVQRNDKSRSGIQSYSRILDTTDRLERLEAEFDDATRALGAAPMHHVRHGVGFRGQLREQAPELAKLVDILRGTIQNKVLLAYGSLLGAVRDGQLLAHDDDFDVFVPIEASTEEEFESRKRELYLKLEAKHWHVEPNKGYRNAHLSLEGHASKLDMFAVWVNGDTAWTHMERMTWRSMPSTWFTEVRELEVDGIRILASRDATDFLAERYGPDWRTPDKYHDWRWKLRD